MSLYYTECDKAFFNKLIDLGFKNPTDVQSKWAFISIDILSKQITDADSRSDFFPNVRKLAYITNEDLLRLILQQNIMNKKIAIKVATPEISKIIQEFLFTKGFKWGNGKSFVGAVYPNYILTNCAVIGPNNLGECNNVNWITEHEHVIYDASTQFGAIIDLFNKPPKPVIKVKNDAGDEYEAVFDKGYVKFGYAKITNAIFATLNASFEIIGKSSIPGDSKEIEQIKIGHRLFTPAVIKQIVKHPDFNK